MRIAPIVVAVSLFSCGSPQALSTSEQQFSELTDELRAATNCGQQNAECHRADASVPDCRGEMRACVAARSPLRHTPALDALHACNAAYDACADDDGGTTTDCEAEHRACLCTVFTDAWADFCANVALVCVNNASPACTRATANCRATPPQPGVCR